MRRFVWSVVVLALEMSIAIMVISCAGCASSRSTGRVDRFVVPTSVSRASLEGFDIVSFLDVDLHTAVQTREAVETEFKSGYGRAGHPRWFFHAFDGNSLDFVVARYEPTGSRYVAERRLRVKRSRAAERALGVTEVVREYEIGTRGVKAGMSRREVTAVVGRPQSWIPREQAGSFDLMYPAFCVRFTKDRVAHVWRRDECAY